MIATSRKDGRRRCLISAPGNSCFTHRERGMNPQPPTRVPGPPIPTCKDTPIGSVTGRRDAVDLETWIHHRRPGSQRVVQRKALVVRVVTCNLRWSRVEVSALRDVTASGNGSAARLVRVSFKRNGFRAHIIIPIEHKADGSSFGASMPPQPSFHQEQQSIDSLEES